MPCIPKKTLDLIRSLGCHFLSQVKANCRTLYQNLVFYTAFNLPMSTCETYEEGHGRCEFRRVELYENKAELPADWNGITRLVKVRRWGTRGEKPYHEVSFFILSKPINSAQTVAKGIRGHWGIENKLHWVKDVVIGEDDMTITHSNAATVVAHLNTTALNLLQLAGMKPNKDAFALITNKVKELYKLFGKTTEI